MKTRGWKMEDGEWLAHSKTWRSFVALLLFLATAITGHAQYSIDWFTIDGGGGASSNGQFTVAGTVGQPDAGVAMSGGNFSVSGGFWSLIAVVQTAGAPTLTVTHSGTSVMISWPASSTGYSLEHNSNLSLPNNWSAVSQGSTLNNGVFSVTIPLTAGNDFFRLKK
jgi:hypothetical protein